MKCKLHCNVELKATKLHALEVLNSASPTTLISSVVCSTKEETCMYGTCTTCKGSLDNIYKDTTKKLSAENVNYFEWSNSIDIRTTTKGEIKVNMVTKVMKSDTLGNLCKNFEHELFKLMPHEYRINTVP